MISLLIVIALASVSFSSPIITIPTSTNSTLEGREIESSEYPNLQMNTYAATTCTGGFYEIDTQYNIKEVIVNTGSYYLTRDLSPGETLKFYGNAQCTGTPVDMNPPNNHNLPGDKRGCHKFITNDVQCYQLTFTAPAPSAPNQNNVQDTCDWNFKAVEDGFIIRGKNFDRQKMKPDGSGLKDKSSKCGALTGFQFLMTPQDPVMQWLATGNLPAYVQSCIGDAVVNAGGNSKGNCT